MSKVISTNIGEKVTIIHNNKEVETGIYKYPVSVPIFLGSTDVEHDQVVDRKYHGGEDKACYLYPSENYDYWKPLFPEVKWEWGMFGENLTIEGLIEADVRIGAIYRIGEALVQVSQPRQPCFKLGVRFNNAAIVKLFSESPFPGIYVRVLEPGSVKTGDSIFLVDDKPQSFTLAEVYKMLMNGNKNEEMIQRAIADPLLAESAKRDLLKLLKKR